jgi:acetyl-CoA carboxylase biotin carboxyl carrier protein
MNAKELKELIEFLVEKDIAEFELERGDLKVKLKRGQQASIATPITPVVVAAPAAPVAAAPFIHVPSAPPPAAVPQSSPAETAAEAPGAPAAQEDSEAGLHIVRSPIVGTYYEAPSPGAPSFVKVGDTVSVGQVVCIVEAMKLMNEIESDVAGEVVKIFVSNTQPVEYGQKLFGIRAR